MAPNKVAAVVLTAIPLEAQAVLRHLCNRRRELEAGIWFEIGQFGSWTVAVGETGAGNIRAATVAAHAITHFKPQIAAFVGMAGALKM
jgi:nucleoside phosphorylase